MKKIIYCLCFLFLGLNKGDGQHKCTLSPTLAKKYPAMNRFLHTLRQDYHQGNDIFCFADQWATSNLDLVLDDFQLQTLRKALKSCQKMKGEEVFQHFQEKFLRPILGERPLLSQKILSLLDKTKSEIDQMGKLGRQKEIILCEKELSQNYLTLDASLFFSLQGEMLFFLGLGQWD